MGWSKEYPSENGRGADRIVNSQGLGKCGRQSIVRGCGFSLRARQTSQRIETFSMLWSKVRFGFTISLIRLRSAYLMHHGFRPYSALIRPKMDPTSWGEPVRWH